MRAPGTTDRKQEEKHEEEGSENKCKQEKRRVPGSAIRRLVEVLEEQGDENGCMIKEQLLGLYKEVFCYTSEKPLYGVINRAIRRRKVYTIPSREGVMTCSRRVHERKLLSLLEDIYLSGRPNPRKKFKDEIPDVDKERYLIYAIQHLLGYEEVSSIVRPNYSLISNVVKLGDTRLLQEAKRRLSLRDLREAIELYDSAIRKIVTLKAKTIAPRPELVDDIVEKLYKIVRDINTIDDLNRLIDELNELKVFKDVVASTRLINSYKLSLLEMLPALKELHDFLWVVGDVFTFLNEIRNDHEKMYEELRATTFNVMKKVLEEGELRGECSLCGRPVHDDFEINLLKSILDIFLLPPNVPVIKSY
jgi:hypothetical protein